VGSSLAGRTALVTGASRGIGAAIAVRLAAEGAAVVLAARTLHAGEHKLGGSLEETADRIREIGGRVLAVPTDITHEHDRERVLAAAVETFGTVDILVNNAAVSWFLPTLAFPEKRLALMYEALLHAPLALSQLVLPGMIERGAGWIVNISSTGARLRPGPPFGDVPPITVYGMFKAALERLTNGLAAETYDRGICVTCVAPEKLVTTEGAVLHGFDKRNGAANQEPPTVMADAVLALCTADRDAVTGRTFLSGPLLAELGCPEPTS
jgi:NAD(P)-dependent dehydrogenase (short-subunit alcohol dehydrogenase family)